jgi:hypothetical protein
MRLDYSGTKIIQIFIVTNRPVILDQVVLRTRSSKRIANKINDTSVICFIFITQKKKTCPEREETNEFCLEILLQKLNQE